MPLRDCLVEKFNHWTNKPTIMQLQMNWRKNAMHRLDYLNMENLHIEETNNC